VASKPCNFLHNALAAKTRLKQAAPENYPTFPRFCPRPPDSLPEQGQTQSGSARLMFSMAFSETYFEKLSVVRKR
jgi:hypothetical protein